MNPEYVHHEGGGLLIAVDLGIYDQSALLKTVHLFTGRCHVHVQHQSERLVEVRFRPKAGVNVDLETLSRDFCNELLDQTLRVIVAKETERERDLILAHALSKHPTLASPPAVSSEAGTQPNNAQ